MGPQRRTARRSGRASDRRPIPPTRRSRHAHPVRIRHDRRLAHLIGGGPPRGEARRQNGREARRGKGENSVGGASIKKKKKKNIIGAIFTYLTSLIRIRTTRHNQ